MSYQRDREEFLALLTAELDGDARTALEAGRQLMRDANTVQRLAMEHCNRELRPNEIVCKAVAQYRITECISTLGDGWAVRFDTDPHGACVKLRLPSGRHNSWDSESWCVPTRRY